MIDRLRVGDLIRLHDTSDDGFDGIDIGPTLVTVVGAIPEAGKTALVTQAVGNALANDSDATCLIANVETSFDILLARMLSRASGIPFADLRDGRLDEHDDSFAEGVEHLRSIAGRLAFLPGPYTTERLRDAVADIGPSIVVLDYAQQFQADAKAEERRNLAGVMTAARDIAMGGDGRAVVVISAVSRGMSGTVNMAAYKGASEIEYAADVGYVLLAPDQTDTKYHELHTVKSRHSGRPAPRKLLLFGDHQTFEESRE